MYVTREKNNPESVIGLGATEAEAIEEPINNGYTVEEIEICKISAVEYQKYIDLYT